MSDFRDLVQAVHDGSAAASGDEAERALLATLEALGAHLSAASAQDLASGLPDAAAGALRGGGGAAPQPGGGMQVYAEVARQLGTDETTAADRAQAALRALAGAVEQERLDRVRPQLPEDIARLLQREDEGDTSVLHTGA